MTTPCPHSHCHPHNSNHTIIDPRLSPFSNNNNNCRPVLSPLTSDQEDSLNTLILKQLDVLASNSQELTFESACHALSEHTYSTLSRVFPLWLKSKGRGGSVSSSPIIHYLTSPTKNGMTEPITVAAPVVNKRKQSRPQRCLVKPQDENYDEGKASSTASPVTTLEEPPAEMKVRASPRKPPPSDDNHAETIPAENNPMAKEPVQQSKMEVVTNNVGERSPKHSLENEPENHPAKRSKPDTDSGNSKITAEETLREKSASVYTPDNDVIHPVATSTSSNCPSTNVPAMPASTPPPAQDTNEKYTDTLSLLDRFLKGPQMAARKESGPRSLCSSPERIPPIEEDDLHSNPELCSSDSFYIGLPFQLTAIAGEEVQNPKRGRGRPAFLPKFFGPKRKRGRPRTKSPVPIGPKRPRGRPRVIKTKDSDANSNKSDTAEGKRKPGRPRIRPLVPKSDGPKRGRGRPRTRFLDVHAPKRPRGRPRSDGHLQRAISIVFSEQSECSGSTIASSETKNRSDSENDHTSLTASPPPQNIKQENASVTMKQENIPVTAIKQKDISIAEIKQENTSETALTPKGRPRLNKMAAQLPSRPRGRPSLTAITPPQPVSAEEELPCADPDVANLLLMLNEE